MKCVWCLCAIARPPVDCEFPYKPYTRKARKASGCEVDRRTCAWSRYLVIPNVMDEEWLGQANAAVDIAMDSEGYNEFSSGACTTAVL
jgi:hypothetical protein